jgi:dTMP kinase
LREKVLKPGTVLLENEIHGYLIKEPEIDLISPHERVGKYVAIEGIDGSGKTTLSGMICNEVKRSGKECDIVKEPYYEEVKSLLHKMPSMHPVAEAYLFAADRLIMHSERLIHLLKSGKNRLILGDRSYLASIVYQSTRGAPFEVIMSLNSFAVQPDLVILLDVDPSIAWERLMKKSNRQLKHLEAKETLSTLRKTYLELYQKIEKPPIEVIDASPSPEEVLEKAMNLLRMKGIL